MEPWKEGTRVFDAYYDYALHEAQPETVKQRREAYEAADFSEREKVKFSTYWTLCAKAGILDAQDAEREKLLQELGRVREDGLDAERYWAYVNGRQSECFGKLLESARENTLTPQELVCLFNEAFVILEHFPLTPMKRT